MVNELYLKITGKKIELIQEQIKLQEDNKQEIINKPIEENSNMKPFNDEMIIINERLDIISRSIHILSRLIKPNISLNQIEIFNNYLYLWLQPLNLHKYLHELMNEYHLDKNLIQDIFEELCKELLEDVCHYFFKYI